MEYLEQYTKKQMEKFNEIEKNIGLTFENSDLLETALTHRSYLNEHQGAKIENNERLEYLGDAVLELIISDYIFRKYTDKAEGELTSIRSAVVRTESLAEQSRELGIGENLRMSKGEKDSGGKDKDYLLANAYEAVLGAIYMDRGMEECVNFVNRTLVPKIDHIVENHLFVDPKTQAQEIIQARYKTTPTYVIVKEEGPDHDKKFTVALRINNKEKAQGQGTSKQKAEESAALAAIEEIEKESESLN